MLSNVLQFLVNILKFHKLKILTAILSFCIFLVLLFPFGDLGDLVTEQVSNATGNSVFLTFENLDVSFIPSPSISMEKVKVDTREISNIEASYFSVAPSIASLLALKLGGYGKIEGLYSGDIEASISQGEKNESGIPSIDIDVEISGIELSEAIDNLKQSQNIPINIKGKANLDTDLNIDPSFEKQIDGEIKLETKKLVLPPANIPTPFGELPFPAMNFSQLEFEGKMAEGGLQIVKLNLGGASDQISARVKGQVEVKFVKRGSRVQQQLGAYDIQTELIVKKGVDRTFSLFLNFLDRYKRTGAKGDTYLFKASGKRFGPPPNLKPLSSF